MGKQEERICPGCGKAVELDRQICRSCGRFVAGAQIGMSKRTRYFLHTLPGLLIFGLLSLLCINDGIHKQGQKGTLSFWPLRPSPPDS